MNEKFLRLLNNDANLYPTKLEQELPHIFSKLVDFWEVAKSNSILMKSYLMRVMAGMVSMTTLVMSFGSYIFID
jgi:hypothetical protein